MMIYFQFQPEKKKKAAQKPRSKTLVSQQPKLLQPKLTAEENKKTKAEPTADVKDTKIDSKPAAKKPARAQQKSPQKPKVGKKRPIKVALSSDEEEAGPPVKKSPAKASKKKGKAALSSSSEEEDFDEVEVQPLKKRLARATAKKVNQAASLPV